MSGSRGQRRLSVLQTIAANPDRSTGDIARMLGLVKPAVTQKVNELERNGLVTRESNARDRRLVKLRATKAGAAMVQETAP